MGLESANFISGLVETNPTGTDQRSTADDHIRLIKSALKNSFPGVNSAVSATAAEMNFLKSASANLQDQINAKLGKSGGTVSGSVMVSSEIAATSMVASFSEVNIQQRYHDSASGVAGSDHFIVQPGGTALTIYYADDDWSIGGLLARFSHSGAATLYHAGLPRIRTTASGIGVTGIISASGGISARYANSASNAVSANHCASAIQANSAVNATSSRYASSANHALNAAYAASAGFAAQAFYAATGPAPSTTAAGFMRAANNTEAANMASPNIAISPANLAALFAATGSTNGVFHLPGGWKLNFGTFFVLGSGNSQAVSFSSPFAVGVSLPFVTVLGAAANQIGVESVGLSGMVIRGGAGDPSARNGWWGAFGR